MVEIAPTAQGGEQQYAIVYVPQGDGEAEPVSEAALSMLQLQSSGGQWACVKYILVIIRLTRAFLPICRN